MTQLDPRWPDGCAAQTWDLEAARDYCEALLTKHAGFDPLSHALRDPKLRREAASLYAFARVANRFADAPEYEGTRTHALELWEEQLERAFHGEAWHPVFVALADTVRRFDVPITPLYDLLAGFRMDVSFGGFSTFAELRRYAMLSAAPAGRLLMHLGAERRPGCLALADDLSVALRLIDVIVDLERDVAAGRVYLPREDLIAFEVDEAALGRPEDGATMSAARRELMHFQVARASAWLVRARPLLRRLETPLRDTVSSLWGHGARVVESLRREGVAAGAMLPAG